MYVVKYPVSKKTRKSLKRNFKNINIFSNSVSEEDKI